MPAHLRQPRHRVEEALRYVPRVRARETDSFDPRHFVYGFEQAAEIARRIVGCRVVVHDLSEQLDFLAPGFGCLPNLREDVGLRTHTFVAARIRHDAEAAELVA